MNGGLVFAGQLLPRLPFALEMQLRARAPLRARDERRRTGVDRGAARLGDRAHACSCSTTSSTKGQTLVAIRSRLFELGAREVLLAAFAVKERARTRGQVMADFTGIRVPDRFVFGFGMDVGGSWRNLPSIRALAETAD